MILSSSPDKYVGRSNIYLGSIAPENRETSWE